MTTLVFGDSFIGPFTLIDDKNLKIFKYKGGTMKGITKEDNENRKNIIKNVNKYNNIKCIIFNFGQVDLFFSYYYSNIIQKKKFMISSFIKKYVEFIHSLNCNNCNKIIFAVYPSVINDKYVFDYLFNYGILSKDIINSISEDDKKKLSDYKFRFNLFSKFNNLLEKYSNLYNITFINLGPHLLNKYNKVKPLFIDPISKLNIHLLWEPLLPIIISKLKCCNIINKFKINLKKSYNSFIKYKQKTFKNKYNSIK